MEKYQAEIEKIYSGEPTVNLSHAN
jgi:hypothetical protein